MRVRYAKLALDRILEIAEFRFPDDEKRARAWMAEVLDQAAQLETFPRMGQRVPGQHGAHPPMRRLLFKDVWIVYEVREAHSDADEGHVLVLTVRHVREKPEGDA